MKKLITMALLASFMLSTFAMPLQATTSATTLSVEEAATRAIRNNTRLVTAQENELVTYEDIRRAREGVFDARTDIALTNANVTLMNAELAWSLNIRDIQIQRENVEFRMTNYFNTVLNAQADLELLRANLEMAKRDLAIAELRLSLGLSSELDFETAEIAVIRLENNITAQENTINRAFRNLNSFMGVNVNNLEQRHVLELDLSFEPLPEINLNRHMQRFVSESIGVANLEGQARAATYRADHYIVPHNPLTGEINRGPGTRTYDEMRIFQSQAVRDVADARTAISEGVIESYNSIRATELNIRTVEIELTRLTRQLAVSETMLELGRTTSIEVDRLRLQIAETENSLQQLRNSHAIMRISFENPNIIMGS